VQREVCVKRLLKSEMPLSWGYVCFYTCLLEQIWREKVLPIKDLLDSEAS